MSSMRNAVQRRNHKERAQPLERQKWGVLEKHKVLLPDFHYISLPLFSFQPPHFFKDYSLRAADYNAKKARLSALRSKAAERNPDEFHFAMMSSKTDTAGRRVADRGNKALSMEAVKLLKTQDVGYVRTVLQKTRRARERLEEEFVLGGGEGEGVRILGRVDGSGAAEKVVFVGSREEQRAWDGMHDQRVDGKKGQEEMGNDDEMEVAEDVQAKQKIPSKSRLEAQAAVLNERRAVRKQHRREQETRRSKLEALKVRERDLMATEQEMEMQRARMSSSVGGVTKAGLKWKVRERKK
ncbi:hypothetical protein MMC19_003118 [Ptychographa xylographoides]|nr:hypothetical protein [Ptychographa xylographoides]